MQRCKNAICSRSAILLVWHVQEVPYWLPGPAMLVATTWWVATCLLTGLAMLSRDFQKQKPLFSRRQTCRILSCWIMGSFLYLHWDGWPCLAFVNMIKVDYSFCLQIKGFEQVGTSAFHCTCSNQKGLRSSDGLQSGLWYTEKRKRELSNFPRQWILEPFL